MYDKGGTGYFGQESSEELKYLREKADRLEKHRQKMTYIGPKSDGNLKHMFNRLIDGVEKRKEKLENPVCEWSKCKESFQNVEELYSYCKDLIENVIQKMSHQSTGNICMPLVKVLQEI